MEQMQANSDAPILGASDERDKCQMGIISYVILRTVISTGSHSEFCRNQGPKASRREACSCFSVHQEGARAAGPHWPPCRAPACGSLRAMKSQPLLRVRISDASNEPLRKALGRDRLLRQYNPSRGYSQCTFVGNNCISNVASWREIHNPTGLGEISRASASISLSFSQKTLKSFQKTTHLSQNLLVTPSLVYQLCFQGSISDI